MIVKVYIFKVHLIGKEFNFLFLENLVIIIQKDNMIKVVALLDINMQKKVNLLTPNLGL